MRNFRYTRAASESEALTVISENPGARFLAGGTNLVDLMRENIDQTDLIIDISRLPIGKITPLANGGVRIGATVRNAELASNPVIRERYPVLSQAILNGASGQIRNVATTAGNLLQRTRCTYFYDLAARCNKREAGAGCDAVDGHNRNHAILGASVYCVATHPSDMCVALAALDAEVQVNGPRGARSIPLEDFHRLPHDETAQDTELASDELVTSVDLPRLAWASRSGYRKARDRASYAFALVSVAAALDVQRGRIANVRIALGGVAHKPWRARQAEKALQGERPDEEVFARAARAELLAAQPLAMNGFKVDLAANLIVSLLSELTNRAAAS